MYVFHYIIPLLFLQAKLFEPQENTGKKKTRPEDATDAS